MRKIYSELRTAAGQIACLALFLALYGRHGFRSVGRRRNYYEHPREDAIIMTREFTDGTADSNT